MGISISFNVPSPLGALASSIFSSTNAQFPPGMTGPAITFTALAESGQQFTPNEPVNNALFAFSAGTTRLYLPQQIQTQFGANYEDAAIGNLAKAALRSGLTMQGFTDAIKGGLTSATQNGLGMAESFTGVTGAQDAYNLANNQAVNNHMEVMFRGINFRTFSFEFKFFPKNSGEMSGLKSILDGFKYHMHPSFKDPGTETYFVPPSKYSIAITNGGSVFGGYTDAVLVDMSVNYSGAGVAAVHFDGNPAEVDLSLTFKETKYLTKETIAGK